MHRKSPMLSRLRFWCVILDLRNRQQDRHGTDKSRICFLLTMSLFSFLVTGLHDIVRRLGVLIIIEEVMANAPESTQQSSGSSTPKAKSPDSSLGWLDREEPIGKYMAGKWRQWLGLKQATNGVTIQSESSDPSTAPSSTPKARPSGSSLGSSSRPTPSQTIEQPTAPH